MDEIHTDDAPAAIGPCSQGIVDGDRIFVTDVRNYADVNEVYAEYMSEPYPARSAVEVADLPIDSGVETEVIASR